MLNLSRPLLTRIVAALIVLGTLAGVAATYRRWHVEVRNRSIEIGLEWPEVSTLAQISRQPVGVVLARLKAEHVTSLIIAEDTALALEEAGAIHPQRVTWPDGRFSTSVQVDSPITLQRIRAALAARGIPELPSAAGSPPPAGSTEFTAGGATPVRVPMDYANLRLLGLGLPPDAVAAARSAHLYIVGRIANFPGVTDASAKAVLDNLRRQDAHLVIFNGDEVLGYKSLEKDVADMLRGPVPPPQNEQAAEAAPSETGLIYGAVEFSKQRGDQTLTSALQGDYVRVHAIQVAEMSQMDPEEMVERFVRAVRERNIRFCFVRLPFQVGPDPLGANVAFLDEVTRSMERGDLWTGGGLSFGAAHRFLETRVPTALFFLLALGTAAGLVWMVRAFCPLPRATETLLLAVLCIVCLGLATRGDTGRKVLALLAGIAFPTVACLLTYPRPRSVRESLEAGLEPVGADKRTCVVQAVRSLAFACAITAVGIIHVAGLLATRPFMLETEQFLGIKAQHAVPIFLVALAAVVGGVAIPGESWTRFKSRARQQLRAVYDEPARFGLLLLGIVALAALFFMVARTGNDAGVGVSGFELRFRNLLDQLMPARPRTKEFLVGHPAFILALAWWWRGRRKLAIPAFIVGSVGQVSILNTFCHIHTPLIISAWHVGLGLILGVLIGIGAFFLLEAVLPTPDDFTTRYARDTETPRKTEEKALTWRPGSLIRWFLSVFSLYGNQA
ncbi:MAG TPA: DUF5693 family protein [Chthonomonadaceae bacterium]|nr:DUF5693 family protein [Chthonomonadaceae bacterium]